MYGWIWSPGTSMGSMPSTPTRRAAGAPRQERGGGMRARQGRTGGRPPPGSPSEEARGVGVVLLGVATGVHVEDEPGGAVRDAAVAAEGEAEMGLADARGPVDPGEGAGQQPTPEHVVQSRQAGRSACGH